MDPVAMVAMWAAAVVSVTAAGKIFLIAFTKATRAVVNEEFRKVWRDLDESDRWHQERFSKFEQALEALREQVERLERLMQEHVNEQR
jgi:TolA-binding protein